MSEPYEMFVLLTQPIAAEQIVKDLDTLLIEQGGVLNARAKFLPKPAYPSEAKNKGLGGSIPMRVWIDERGNVIGVKAICGNPILANASEVAARNAKFETVLVNGNPIKYSGILVYTFVP